MTQIHAQPYDLAANGFYFESLAEFQTKAKANRNDYGQPVEEYELQFIDGDAIDCDLATAWAINQANIGQYFDAVDDWDDHGKRMFIIAVGLSCIVPQSVAQLRRSSVMPPSLAA